jgi:hypothetical protein
LKLFQEWGRQGEIRMMEGVNLSIVYLINFKNFYKCHNVLPAQQLKTKRIENRGEKRLSLLAYFQCTIY